MINTLRLSSLVEWLQLKGIRIRISRPALSSFLITACLLIGSLIPRLFYAHTIPLDYDEGHLLMFGTLAALGHTPYTETFAGIPPMAILRLPSGAWLVGDALGQCECRKILRGAFLSRRRNIPRRTRDFRELHAPRSDTAQA